MRDRDTLPGSRSLATDDRAVSTAVGYVLSLAIMALLISGLLIAGGTFIDGQQDRVSRDQVEVLGERVASSVENVDRMAGAGNGPPVVSTSVDLPARTVGSQYRITVNNTTATMAADRPYAYELRLETIAGDIDTEREIPIRTHHPMVENTLLGGDIVVSYYDEDGDGDHELVLSKETPIGSVGDG